MLEQVNKGAVMYSQSTDHTEQLNDFAMMLQTLLDRYPNHPYVIATLRLSRELTEIVVGTLMKKQS